MFVEIQLVKIFLSKIDKKFLDLVTLRIILNYDSKVLLVQAFAKVKKYDKTLCQYNAIDIVALMIDVSKSKKMAIAISSLAKIHLEKTMHYWRCDEFGHIKNNSNCLKKKKDLHMEKFKPKAEMAKFGDKSKKKQLKCFHCGKIN